MTGKPICIYHGNCADGFGAAWAVWKRFPSWDFFAGIHQTEPPDVTGRDVVMVDFTYKRPVLEEMAQTAKTIAIFDHHKSAAEDLEPFTITEASPGAFSWNDIDGVWRDFDELERPKVLALFDMERSGAGITWDVFHGGQRPQLIDHIEDRDLWRFDLDGTREIQACLFSYPYDFDTWDKLIMSTPIEALRQEGEAIERKHHKDVAELVAVTKRRMSITGYDVPVASLPYTLVSDAAHMMAEGEPFAACYWDTEKTRIFGLRSTDDGIDVSEVAKIYGGGGHKNAAGFAVPRDHALARA